MSAARLTRNVPLEVTLATTLTEIIPGDGVRVVQVSAPSAIYLVYDDSLADGGTVPASARFRIPAGAIWPIEVTGTRVLLAAVEGTVDVGLLGVSAGQATGLLGGAPSGPEELVLTPSTQQDDVDLGTATMVVSRSTASVVYTGFVAGLPGQVVTFRNASGYLNVLAVGPTDSAAANRMQNPGGIGASLVLCDGDEVRLAYDGDDERWIVTPIRRLLSHGDTPGHVRRLLPSTGTTIVEQEVVFSDSTGTRSTPTPVTGGTMAAARFRLKGETGAVSSNVAGWRAQTTYPILPSAGGLGGFAAEIGWGYELCADTAVEGICGLSATSSPGVGNPYTDMASVAAFTHDNGDANWSFSHNDAAGVCTQVPLGAGFPVSATPVFRGTIFNPPGATRISYALVREDDLTIVPAVGDVTTNLPTVGMGPYVFCTTKAAASREIWLDGWELWTP